MSFLPSQSCELAAKQWCEIPLCQENVTHAWACVRIHSGYRAKSEHFHAKVCAKHHESLNSANEEMKQMLMMLVHLKRKESEEVQHAHQLIEELQERLGDDE